MSILPLQTARVSSYLRATQSLGSINNTQSQLLDVQNQLSSGVQLTAGSDNPGNAAIAIQLQRTLDRNTAYSDALKDANGRLSLVDSTLGDVTSILRQAQSLASANVGSDVTPDQRNSAAAVVQSIYNQLLTLANRQSNGLYLFAGDKGTAQPYVETNGGVKFVGTGTVLQNRVDATAQIGITTDGSRIFGGGTVAAQGLDLAPGITPATRLSDVAGATGSGVSKGSILLSDGTTSRSIDLSRIDTVKDVVDAINSTGLATASVTGTGLLISPITGTASLSISEVGGGSTAADLGILSPTSPGAGLPITGSSLKPELTALTPLSALNNGSGLNLSSGFQITNGGKTFNIDLSSATTVQDVLNAVNGSGSGALAKINDAGNGIDILNTTQGTALSVSDTVTGGAASILGIRTFTPTTPLASLNNGRGVQLGQGPDIEIVSKAGTSYQVDLDGAVTVQDVINRINTATGGAVNAFFTGVGNAIGLTDTTGGTGPITVRSANSSTAATDLGIAGTTTGTQLAGTDVNPVRSAGVFDNLLQLATALRNNDQNGITRAAQGLQTNLQGVITAQGANGAVLKEVQTRQADLDSQNLATKSLLSDLIDTDYPSAITRFQLLQTALQANYSTTSRLANQSLLDFLR